MPYKIADIFDFSRRCDMGTSQISYKTEIFTKTYHSEHRNISSSYVHRYKTMYTDKKENQIFLIYQEIQNGVVAKPYMTDGLLINREIFKIPSYIRKPFSYMTLQLLRF